MDQLTCMNIFNFNASRCKNTVKIQQFYEFFEPYDPTLVSIQEINVASALKVFSDIYQVYVNVEQESVDGIGIVTLVKKDVKISDVIIGKNGRIIGVKLNCIQFWNIYPKSGSAHKKERELFFRETLCNLFVNWKDSTEFVFQSGDHNCTHREEDSLNNRQQHIQPGLIKHMQIHGLADDFIKVHGKDQIMYSRITQQSSTRIDYVMSNTNKCYYFQYLDMGMGLDHKAMYAKYDIDIVVKREFIPRDRFYSGWVISKQLEKDELFLESCKFVFEQMKMEDENGNRDPSFNWLKTKTAIINIAKEREKQIRYKEKKKMEVLWGFYCSILSDMQRGVDCRVEFENVVQNMNEYYEARSKKMIDKIRGQEIDDQVYDIHKLQNQRKYEGQKKITELKIEDKIYTGTKDVVNAIEDKMRLELESHLDTELNAPHSNEEEDFISKIVGIQLTEDERESLIRPIEEEEIGFILGLEVDKDSSPGEDGLTYRFIEIFWRFSEYRHLFIKYLNYIREDGSLNLVENIGVMTIKNKKTQSNLYEKKRKLTKVNKESNLSSKVWTNRFKRVIIPKVLPKSQFNCQQDENIIDELREIRMINKHLLGDGNSEQCDGTILSIDFQDAFRSISHRWFNLVLRNMEVPEKFIQWFWTMYYNLHVVIVLNKFKSNKINVKRGFLEGHCPSMAAFVVSLIPLMHALEERLDGIETAGIGRQKIKMFADDLKVFLRNTNEIETVYEVICRFEKVSGLKMHRDPTRGKCQALPFGVHRQFVRWPYWVSVRDKIKVVGGLFSNKEAFEKINSDYVAKCFYDTLHRTYGIRGTIFQKAYYVNTYLFSKLWFTAQFCKLDEKMLKKLLSKALAFIYGGENERPVNSMNFRNNAEGGLGLFHPVVKARALLIKNMYRELLSVQGNVYDMDKISQVYGHKEDFIDIIENGLNTSPSKAIYEHMIKEVTHRNGSLIPSRREKKAVNVKWGLVFKNLKQLRGITAEERCFAWKLSQDMLAVGKRIFRRNAERRCLVKLTDGSACQEIQDINHVFKDCNAIKETYDMVIQVMNRLTERNVSFGLLVHFAFNHRKKQTLKCALWFAVKVMYNIFNKKMFNKGQILRDLIKEIDWNLRLNRKVGSEGEMVKLKDILKEILQN